MSESSKNMELAQYDAAFLSDGDFYNDDEEAESHYLTSDEEAHEEEEEEEKPSVLWALERTNTLII